MILNKDVFPKEHSNGVKFSCYDSKEKLLLEENKVLRNHVRNLKSSIDAAKIGEKEITNVDLLRRISQLEKIILGKEQQ